MHLNISIGDASVHTYTFPYSDVSGVPRPILKVRLCSSDSSLTVGVSFVEELYLHHSVVSIGLLGAPTEAVVSSSLSSEATTAAVYLPFHIGRRPILWRGVCNL